MSHVRLRLLALIWILGVAAPAIAQGNDEAVASLYKNRNLLSKRDYKVVRETFAGRFESRRADDVAIAFGDDREAMSTWLQEHQEIKEEFFNAVSEDHDDVVAALRMFHSLWKKHPDRIAEYAELAIATSVVWDQPRHVYDYGHHQRRTKAVLPEDALDGMGNFDYLVGQRRFRERLQAMPWEFLIYVVNHKTPLTEREWAQHNYAGKLGMIGKCYHDVPYDTGMLEGEIPQLSDKPYTLETIRSEGGVCAMQADFASRVGQSLVVPSAYVGGENVYGGLHAWVMWAEIRGAGKGRINFTLESHGRYRGDNYYTGTLRDPQTGLKILDRDMERRLAAAGADRQGKRHADLAMRAYPIVNEAEEPDLPAKLRYFEACLALSPYNEESWLAIAQLCRDKEIGQRHTRLMTKLINTLFRSFEAYPDFSWRVFDDLTAFQENPRKRQQLYEKLILTYERARRPDLACAARLKLTDYLVEAEDFEDAADGLADTIRKFPEEGRYIPEMAGRLEQVADNLKNGSKTLVRFYMQFLPRIPRTRGRRPSKYCIEMYQRAANYFSKQGEQQAAELIKRELATLKTGG